MSKVSFRSASISCLAVWVAVWILFFLMRVSPLDIRVIPGIGPFLLLALATAILAPLVAGALACAALVRRPRAAWNWLALGLAIAAFFGQGCLFLASRWM